MLRKKVVHFLFNNEAGSLFKPGNPRLMGQNAKVKKHKIKDKSKKTKVEVRTD